MSSGIRKQPPFRAEHVGSLIRPLPLREAREAGLRSGLSASDLKALEDQCIKDAVALQERVGLPSITDGEFRRDNWRDGFFNNVEGFSAQKAESTFEFTLPDGSKRKAMPVPRVVGRLKRKGGIVTEEFRFLQSIVKRGIPKATLPSPSVMHFFRGDVMVDKSIYSDVRAYMADVSAIYREELAELSRLGCTYVQFDDVALPIMCDPSVRELIRGRGEDPEAVIDLYIDALNDAIRDRPTGMTVCVHMCRGNVGHGMASGGYEPIAERMFQRLGVDGFLLEYDTPRAGDFEPLRFVPSGKTVALGLVSTKKPDLEDADAVARRIEEASRFVPLDQLSLCPQCGFSSGFRTVRMSIEEEERKLARIVEVAERVWA